MRFGSRPVDIGDDEVIASYNVYFSPSLVHQAHIFQYPLRRKQRPYEATEVRLFSTSGTSNDGAETSASGSRDRTVFNPDSRLTMKCSLDTFGSPSFKTSQAGSGDLLSQMDVQRLNTYNYTLQSQPFRAQSDYMLGYVTSEGIHLTPVSTIQQFTPALDIPISSNGAVRVGEQFSSLPNNSVTPGFAAADRIKRDLQRQRSHVLNRDADTGREVRLFRATSVESSAMRSRLRSSTLETVLGGSKAVAEPGRIENSLFPPEILQSGGISGGDESNPGMVIQRFANRTSVVEQTTQLLQRCHIITLPLLQSVVVPHTLNEVVRSMASVPETQLVEALKTCAVWMHGVWIGRFSEQFRGSVAALREVVLTRFYQSEDGSLTRTELNSLVSSSASRRAIKDILMTIAVLNERESDPSKRRWQLKYVSGDRASREAATRAFKSSFAAEEASQHEAWKRRCVQVAAHIPYINASRPPPQLFLLARGAAPPTGVQSPTTSSYGGAGAAAAGSLGNTGAGGGQPGGYTAGSSYSSPNVSGADSNFRDADIAPIRNYIRELFTEYGVINKQRVKDLVMRAQESRYPHATKVMLSTALQQSLEKFTDSTWILKSVGEPLVDYYRPTILAIVLELRQFELSALMKRLDEAARERGLTSPPESAASARVSRPGGTSAHSVPEAVVQRVVAEVAEFKSGGRLWHVKGGNLMNE